MTNHDSAADQGDEEMTPEQEAAALAFLEALLPTGAGRTYTREMVTQLLPDATDPQRSDEKAAATVKTAPLREARVSGGDGPQSLPPTWLSYIAPQLGLRPYALSLIRQQDTEAGQCYGLALEWMDRQGYPPRTLAALPEGLLDWLSEKLTISRQTVRRRLARAEHILSGLSLTLS